VTLSQSVLYSGRSFVVGLDTGVDAGVQAGGLRYLSRRKIALDSELYQTCHIVDIQFAHQAGAIGVYRFGTQLEASGDFLSANAFDQQRKYLVFASA